MTHFIINVFKSNSGQFQLITYIGQIPVNEPLTVISRWGSFTTGQANTIRPIYRPPTDP